MYIHVCITVTSCLLLSGIGIGYIVVNALVCIYYNVIIALSIYYLFASLTTELPWASCGHAWNTEACGDPSTDAAGETACDVIPRAPTSLYHSLASHCELVQNGGDTRSVPWFVYS